MRVCDYCVYQECRHVDCNNCKFSAMTDTGDCFCKQDTKHKDKVCDMFGNVISCKYFVERSKIFVENIL